MKGIFVTGTDTNVGKTWVGTKLIEELVNQNIKVVARKPIESGWPSTNDLSETDAWKIAKAIGDIDAIHSVCPNRYSAALSPDRAAMIEGDTVHLQKLKDDCLTNTHAGDFLYVEGAGGLYSPICSDALNVDLAKTLSLPVMLVVEDRLGCINQTLLNIDALKNNNLSLVAIALNQVKSMSDDEGMDNLSDIKKRVEVDVISFKYNQTNIDSIKQLASAVIDSSNN